MTGMTAFYRTSAFVYNDERWSVGTIKMDVGWLPSSGLGTLGLQAPAGQFFGKLELQKTHSQAGAWERAKMVCEARGYLYVQRFFLAKKNNSGHSIKALCVNCFAK